MTKTAVQNHFLIRSCNLLQAVRSLQPCLSPLLLADTTIAACHINVSSSALPGSASNDIIKPFHGAWLMSKNYFEINILFSRFLISIAFSFTASSLQRRMVLVAREGLHDSVAFKFGAKQRRIGE
jgi:hypothetical protein